ncbi:MAG: Dolichol-phosphate mannosyltransferase [Microgenomates group bacterium GW2011_GWC1_44_37]|uniref:Dolichol-phosphate mannosyltransferase n=1 Tax=Candidatus Collierbacteria bacterium GW2011_GWB2_44_22 TaxID=1618387 RepID=A0A0G1HZ91_9BACT|nr:MAG: Dolichol-phosphate mannosyltransferase [Candidatus Collierbacteria bacterium GW2011_GWA2_44_13]KKT52476.1 MAG: Dolichol-phosphate mannosyltransferase [Candidatus Collierbacteria bacterium GW2011_GWB2_44_22]KKT62699.1 MAG: Dolichol-phosphate mannosyltransferase [Candidatus Collierbacteria bacterium GW2011_GWD1_44_27]KKT65547.1 MAG: Dolichol-phosphate mannosyltransferase [Candidatus Collierbacteria bacterium GW2011_GWC2_44_30]KKT69179.1 MAG: Dolichol-phosphate mannosyltransferase [Microge
MPKTAKKKTKTSGTVDLSLLSVIVPAYNCKTIYTDLSTIKLYLDLLNRPYELICVVDGLKNSKDRTADLAKSFRAKNSKIYYYKENKGKGYAVRYGMARAKGGIIAFIDAGNDLHAKGIGLALEHMKWYDADIIIGSKRHHASKVLYPWSRKLLSYIVQKATKFVFGLNVSDTQTGLKVFNRDVLVEVLPRLIVKRWAFDLEILTVANHLGFKRIYESPVEITHNFASNVDISSVRNYFIDYFAIIYRTYILRYYDDGGSDHWEDDPNLKLRYH